MKRPVLRKPGRPRDDALIARRREEILACAIAHFARVGYPNVDLQHVADELGCSKGTLYRYFPTKQELFQASVDQIMHGLLASVDGHVGAIADPLRRVAAAVRGYLAYFDNHPEYVELLIQERAEFRDRKKPTYFEYCDANRQPWAKLWQSLIAQGRVRRVPVQRIMDVIGDLLYGTIFTNYFAGRRKSFQEQADDLLDILMHGLLSDGRKK